MKSIYRKYFVSVALIWTGCFVLFLLVYMLVLVPQNRCRKQVEKQLAERKQTYDFAMEVSQEKSKNQLKERLEHLRNNLNDFAIDFDDSANLTFDISQIASKKGVGLFSIKTRDDRRVSAISNCNHIYESHIDISFTAGFNQFAAFLNAMERHRPVVFVDKFTITRSDKDDSDHQVNMSLAVFVRKRQDS